MVDNSKSKNKKSKNTKTKKNTIEVLAEKYNMSVEEVKNEYSDIANNLDKDTNNRDSVTLHKLKARLKRHARSPSKLYDGVILKIRFIKDIHKNAIKRCEEDFESGCENGIYSVYESIGDGEYKRRKLEKSGNVEELFVTEVPESAIKIDAVTYIVPMDPKSKTSRGNENYRYLEELPVNTSMYSLEGICRQKNNDEYERFTMLFDEVRTGGVSLSQSGFEMCKHVTFKALDWGKTEDDLLFLGAGKVTVFTEVENSEFNIEEELVNHYSDEFTLICDLDEIHDEYIRDTIRTADESGSEPISELEVRGGVNVVIQGYVLDMYLENNWKSINIDDSSMEDVDPDFYGLRVLWGPQLNDHILPFAEESKIIVFGTTTKGKKYDRESKQQIDELGDVSVFATGVYAIPELNTFVSNDNVDPDTYLKEEDEEDDSTDDEEDFE